MNGITPTVPDEDHFVGWLVCGVMLFSVSPLLLAVAVCLFFSVAYGALFAVQSAVTRIGIGGVQIMWWIAGAT